MRLNETVALLGNVPLFSNLSQDQLKILALNGEKVIFLDGRAITKANEPGDAAYLIVSGEAERISGPAELEPGSILSSGTFIGEITMLIETDYNSTIVCRNEVRALKFRRSLIHHLIEADPSLGTGFVDVIHTRFIRFASQLKNIEREMDQTSDFGTRLTDAGISLH